MPGGFGGCVSSLLAQFGRGAASDALNSEEHPMQLKTMIVAFVGAGLFGAVIASAAPSSKKAAASPPQQGFDAEITRSAQAMLDEDRKTFRYETFGSEASGATPSSCTKPSRARGTAASAPASRRRPPCTSASRWTWTRSRTL
jgi:hypothetical protein